MIFRFLLIASFFSCEALALSENQMLDYINSIKTIASNFEQRDSNGGKRTGQFALQKPKNMRFLYDGGDGDKELILYDGSTLFYYNYELAEPNIVPKGDYPLDLILKRIDIKKDLKSHKVMTQGNLHYLIMQPKGLSDGTQVALGFSDKPLALKEIRTIDYNNFEVTLSLKNLKLNQEIDPLLFDANQLKSK